MLKVFSAQIWYLKAGKPDAIDVTRLGAHVAKNSGNVSEGEIFAPSWNLLKAVQSGKVNESQYTAIYIDEMKKSARTNWLRWQALLKRDQIVVCCYEPYGQFCHRHILRAGILPSYGAMDCGEILQKPSREPASREELSKVAYVCDEVRKGQTRDHECHAKGCKRQVPPALVMCKKHWSMVPNDMQSAIWKHFQPGQEKGVMRPTREYLTAMIEAINFVAEIEAHQKAEEPQLSLFR